MMQTEFINFGIQEINKNKKISAAKFNPTTAQKKQIDDLLQKLYNPQQEDILGCPLFSCTLDWLNGEGDYSYQLFDNKHKKDQQTIHALSHVTGRPVILSRDGKQIATSGGNSFTIQKPLEINYNSQTGLYYSGDLSLSFFGHYSIASLAMVNDPNIKSPKCHK